MRSAFVVLAAIAASVVAGGPAAAAESKFRKTPAAGSSVPHVIALSVS